MKRPRPAVTIKEIKKAHAERRDQIRERLDQFAAVWKRGDDRELWEEMVFCFFTGGCSAAMGLRSVEAVRPVLMDGDRTQIANALAGSHRYPNARAGYVVHSREFLKERYNLELRKKLHRGSVYTKSEA